ncbi:bleomycin hydrolase [Kalmusia sp. IMI 367209]|nr:bleomycin hydrolase [Kalmusia sp. IMI 367209]
MADSGTCSSILYKSIVWFLHALYSDAYNAANSEVMDLFMTTKLREDALRLRCIISSAASPKVKKSTVAAEKEKMLREVHLITTLMLGPPPAPDTVFTWEFYDRDKKFRTIRIDPIAFAAELSDSQIIRALGGTDVHALFSLVHDLRNAYNRLLSVKLLGHIYNGHNEKSCIEMLKTGFPAFFGSDVGQYSDHYKGIMDTDLSEYELSFNIKLNMKKAEVLQTGGSK